MHKGVSRSFEYRLLRLLLACVVFFCYFCFGVGSVNLSVFFLRYAPCWKNFTNRPWSIVFMFGVATVLAEFPCLFKRCTPEPVSRFG